MVVVAEDPRSAAQQVVTAHDAEWLAEFAAELDRRRSVPQMRRVMTLLDISKSELGRFFGVSRQAATKWLDEGAPPDRSPAVSDLAAICDLLERYIRRDRIPAVARRPAAGLGNRSLIGLLSSGDTADALRLTRQMFTFTDVHA